MKQVLFRGRVIEAAIRGTFAHEERLRDAVEGAWDDAEVLRRMGLRASGARYAQLKAAKDAMGLRTLSEKMERSKSVLADRSAVSEAVTTTSSATAALRVLGLSSAGSNQSRLLVACRLHGVPIPATWRSGKRMPKVARSRPLRWVVLDDAARLSEASQGATSIAGVARALGWKHVNAADRRAIQDALASSGLVLDASGKYARYPRLERAVLENAVTGAHSISEVLRVLGRPSSARDALLRDAAYWDIDLPKFNPALAPRTPRRVYRIEDVFVEGGTASNKLLRKIILRHELIVYRCAFVDCPLHENRTWRGHPITFVLDHVNGDPRDHRLENLRFVCPNCETQLATHGSKNRRLATL